MSWGRRAVLISAAIPIVDLLPAPALAQPADRMPIVGVLQLAPSEDSPLVAALREGLKQHGFIEGSNVRLVVRHADGRPERLEALAGELAALGCRVIVTNGTTSVQAAQAGAPKLPIVMAGSADPVQFGFARSLARPGGRITGLALLGNDSGIFGKWLELLKEVVPAARAFAALLQAANPGNAAFRRELEGDGHRLGVEVHVREIGGADDIAAAFEWAAGLKVDAVYLIPDPIFGANAEAFARHAVAHRLPTVSPMEVVARAGGLLAYAFDLEYFWRRAAYYVAETLRGVDPGTLPIEQPTAVRLIVNLRTARAIGVTLPPSLLARADEVIE
jgi:putative ABC transport system substrate-binding protein